MADPSTELLRAMVQRVLDTQGQIMDRLDALEGASLTWSGALPGSKRALTGSSGPWA